MKFRFNIQLKKSTLIFLAFFYLIFSSGMSVSLHYCGGKFKSISFFSTGVDERGCCGNKMKSKGCCHEKTTFIKVKDSHFSSANLNINHDHFKTIETIYTSCFLVFPNESITVNSIFNYHSPPVLYDAPLYLQYGVFLI